MRYVVAHVISSPAGAVKTARLVISDVPDKTGRADVIGALEAAGLAAGRFAEGGVPLGNHEVLHEGRNGWPKGVAGVDAAELVTWSRLTTPPQRNDGKRVTLRLTPAEHAAYSLAAQREGESLQEWCVRVLSAAVASASWQAAGRPPGADGKRPAEAASSGSAS